MPLHPQTQAMVDAMAAGNAPATHEQTPADARLGYRALASSFGPGPDVGQVADRTIPGPAGAIPVRVYQPANATDPLPVLLFLHGGGWVIGDLDTHDRECRVLCNEARAMVVAIDYRLAPEHPFPAPHDDCIAALRWLHQHVGEWGGDAARIAVGGDSAGGNLAAYLALAARDEGIGLRLQMLVYPATDVRGHDPDWQGERFASLSENQHGPFLTIDSIHYFGGLLSAGRGVGSIGADWRISPMLAESHAGVAPAYVATCEYDPLRDEGNAYADKLAAAGVRVQHRQWDGQPHVLFQLSPVLDDGRALLAECADALREAFA